MPDFTCHTRALKDAGVLKMAAAPLKVGTLHVVAVTFHTPSGDFGQPVADLDVLLDYLTASADAHAGYVSQYGVGPYTVDMNGPYPWTFNLPGDTYDDAALQGLIGLVATAHGWGPDDAVVIVNPPSGVVNTTAQSQHAAGYHGAASVVYIWIQANNVGWSVADTNGGFAFAASHEAQEAMVDPMVDGTKPEVCDPCSNCGPLFLNYFDQNGEWIDTTNLPFHTPATWAFFTAGCARPANVHDCPAPFASCTYAPPSPPPPMPFAISNPTVGTMLGLPNVSVTWTNRSGGVEPAVLLYCVFYNDQNQVARILSQDRTFDVGESCTPSYSTTLPPGSYKAKLFVQDDQGNALSAPVELPFTV